MTNPVPIRLKREPLLEAIWEMRFGSDREPVSEVLPGMIFKELGHTYDKLVRLPAADIPRQIAERDERLRFLPVVRLEGGSLAIQIGERVVSLSSRKRYVGWSTFSERILELASALRETCLITSPLRFSLKYVDLIHFDEPPSLAYLNLSISLASHDVSDKPVHIRTEIEEGELLHIVQLASPAEAALGEMERLRGVLVDVDTIYRGDMGDFWELLGERLERAHANTKTLFFNLLAEDTLKRLEPVYEEET
jgi:uncharacterized protein (TIGR04255 family)